MRIVIVTGLSGAGKSTSLQALEDIGFYCIDNQPLPALSNVVDLLGTTHINEIAVSVDARQLAFLPRYAGYVQALRDAGHSVDVLFLEAASNVLIRRYSATRRRHPLAGEDLVAGIARDRKLLAQLRNHATVVDTAALNVHQLKGLIQEQFATRPGTMAVNFLTFGFKNGVPPEANLLFDARYLPNPFFVTELSAKDGRDSEVAHYVLDTKAGKQTLIHISQYLEFALPNFRNEGKLYLIVAIGCTGGRHRSVALAEHLAKQFAGEWDVIVRHRDLLTNTNMDYSNSIAPEDTHCG